MSLIPLLSPALNLRLPCSNHWDVPGEKFLRIAVRCKTFYTFKSCVVNLFFFWQESSEWIDWHTNVLSKRNATENVYQWACGYVIFLYFSFIQMLFAIAVFLGEWKFSEWLKLIFCREEPCWNCPWPYGCIDPYWQKPLAC